MKTVRIIGSTFWRSAFAGLSALVLSSLVSAAIWRVDGTIANPGDGSEWNLAMKYVGDALNNPSLANGDSIWVKGGPNASTPLVYYCDESAVNPNGSDLATATFLVDQQIRLIGGFAGGETLESQRGDWLAHPVWLSGDVKHEDPAGQIVTLDNYAAAFLTDPPNYSTLAENALHTVTVRGQGITPLNSVIDGFASIRGGHARIVVPDVVNSDVGGGMFCDGVSPLVRNCLFEFNLSLGDMLTRVGSGGGMYDTSASLEIRDAIFRNNHSAGAGGGLCKTTGDLLAVRLLFEQNWSFQIGGPSSSGSGGRGGGLRVSLEGGEAQVISTIFRENRAGQFGGGASVGRLFSPDFPPTDETGGEEGTGCLGLLPESLAVFTNCLFEGNLVDGIPGGCGGHGGGLRTAHHTEVRNCSFARNAAVFGAAIMANHQAEVLIANSIIWDSLNPDPPPDPPSTCSPSYTAFEGQIFVCQTSPSSCFLAIHDSCVQGLASAASLAATCGWTNNIEMDPKFIDGDDASDDGSDYNLRLIAVSPCIDAADNGNLPDDLGDLDDDSQTVGQELPYDLDDSTRIKFGTSSATVDMGAFEASCLGDIDGNGIVNGLDLASLLSGWDEEGYEPCPPYHGGDLDGDCEVDGVDLALLLGAWGPCPNGGESLDGGGEATAASGGPSSESPCGGGYDQFIQWLEADDWDSFLQWYVCATGAG